MTIKTYGLALKSRKTPIAGLAISRILEENKRKGDEYAKNNIPRKHGAEFLGSTSKAKETIIDIELGALTSEPFTPLLEGRDEYEDIPCGEYVRKPLGALMIGERLNFLLYSSK